MFKILVHFLTCVLQCQWYTDIIIRRLDVTKEIVFDVFDWNAVLSHRKIGTAQVDLSGVPPNGQNYELKLDDDEGVLKVFVKILMPQFNEIAPSYWPKIEKLTSSRVHLDRANYHPGEVVRGHLIIRLRKRTTMAEISIQVAMRIDLNEIIWSVPSPYVSKLHNFVERVKIGRKDDTYEAGLHVFAFQFLLPKNCLTNSAGHSICKMTVIMKRSTLKLEIPEQPILVTPPYDLLTPQVCPYGLPHDSCPEPLQGIVATFNPAPPKLIYTNKPFDLDVTLFNDSNIALSKFRVDLVVVRICFSYADKSNKCHTSKLVDRPASKELDSKIRLEPGQSLPIQVKLTTDSSLDIDIYSVPPEMQPQTMQVFHHLLITAKNKTTGKRAVCLRHPVFVLDERMYREGGLDTHLPDLEPAKLRVAQVLDLPTQLSLMAPSMHVGMFGYRYLPGIHKDHISNPQNAFVGDSLPDHSFSQLPTASLKKKSRGVFSENLPLVTSAVPDRNPPIDSYPRDILH